MMSKILSGVIAASALVAPLFADEPKPVAAAPSLTPAQKQRLVEHDRYAEQVKQLRAAGKLDEALTLADKMVAIHREVFGPVHSLVAQSLALVGEIHAQRADFPKARQVCTEVLGLYRQLHPEGHWRLVEARFALDKVERLASLPAVERRRLARALRLDAEADQLRQQQRFAQAIPLAEEAVQIRTRALGEDDRDTLRSLAVLCLCSLFGPDRDAKAELFRLKGVETARKKWGEKHPEYASSLILLAGLHVANLVKQGPLAEQAAEILLEALGPADLDYATRVLSTALLLFNKSRARSEQVVLKAIEIHRATGRDKDREFAMCLGYLASIHMQAGGKPDLARAEAALKEQASVLKERVAEEPRDYIRCLETLAALYYRKGVPELAEPLRREAQEIEQRRPKDGQGIVRHPRDYARVFGERQAMVARYRERREFARVKELYETWLKMDQQLFGYRPSDDLSGLAQAYKDLGDKQKALALWREAIEVDRQRFGEHSQVYASALNRFAQNLRVLGKPEEAEPLENQALDLTRAAMGEKSLPYAQGLTDLARRHADRGEDKQAVAIYQQALDILTELGGAIDPRFAPGIYWGALNYARKGAFTPAIALFQKQLTYNALYLENVFPVQSESQRLLTLRESRSVLDWYIQVARSAPREVSAAELYRQVLSWKNVAGPRPEERLADEPKLKNLVDRLRQARTQLAELAFAPPPPDQQKQWIEQLNRLRNDKENLESELSRRSRAYRQYKEQRRLGPAEVARALPAGVALVDFFEYASGVYGGGERRLLGFVLRRDKEVICLDITASPYPMEWLVAAWRNSLLQGDAETLKAPAARLGEQLWKPLQPHLAGARTVLIAPDGPLNRLPFAALPGGRPGSFLIEDIALGYVTSGRDVVDIFNGSAQSQGHGLLAIGGIDYQADAVTAKAPSPAPSSTQIKHDPGAVVSSALTLVRGRAERAARPLLDDRDRGRISPLPGTAIEARSCRQLFAQTYPNEPATLLTGLEPSESRVKQEFGKGYRYIHLATHGFFESPRRVAALRSDTGRLEKPSYRPDDAVGRISNPSGRSQPQDLRVKEDQTFALMPLLRSGLVLAGAVRPPAADAPAEEDGILTAEEVTALDLRGTELVVLSACDTGLGEIEQGQGVLGLQRAFQAAGARALVTSLWKVDDAATSVLMTEFYKNLWQKQLPKLEALRQAQLAVLRHPQRVRQPGADQTVSSSHPALWAAFVLSGDIR